MPLPPFEPAQRWITGRHRPATRGPSHPNASRPSLPLRHQFLEAVARSPPSSALQDGASTIRRHPVALDNSTSVRRRRAENMVVIVPARPGCPGGGVIGPAISRRQQAGTAPACPCPQTIRLRPSVTATSPPVRRRYGTRIGSSRLFVPPPSRPRIRAGAMRGTAESRLGEPPRAEPRPRRKVPRDGWPRLRIAIALEIGSTRDC